MNDLHQLAVHAADQKAIEMVHEQFLHQGLLRAREKTIAVTHEIKNALEVGMTEDDARRLSLQIFANHGVTKHWHKPYIRFGQGTTLTFHNPLQPDYKLQYNDPFYIDLGPIWPEDELGLQYEGDYGDTFVLGENKEAEYCAQTSRNLFQEALVAWKKDNLSGQELYKFLERRAQECGYTLLTEVDGHRLSDFSHHQYSKERLIHVPFMPTNALWVLEIQIVHPTLPIGAFYEDLLI